MVGQLVHDAGRSEELQTFAKLSGTTSTRQQSFRDLAERMGRAMLTSQLTAASRTLVASKTKLETVQSMGKSFVRLQADRTSHSCFLGRSRLEVGL